MVVNNTKVETQLDKPIAVEEPVVETQMGASDVVSGVAPSPTESEGVEIQQAPPTTPAEARETIIEKQVEGLANTEEQANNLESEANAKMAEDKAREEKRIKEEVDFRKQQEDIIKAKDEATKETQEEIDTLAEDRKVRDVDILKGEAVAANDLAKQALALQKKKDEEAIFFAERNVELEKQKSAWAFNKLGLGFSSGIILQAQDIATQGAVKIATLKVQANFNQAKLQLEAIKIQNDYSGKTNAIIDKYTDVQIRNKQDIANRINDTQSNVLLNNEQKQREVNRLQDEYIANKRDIESNLKTDQQTLADRVTKQAEELERTIQREKNENIAKLDVDLATGNIVNMTDSAIAQTEDELGLTPGTIKRRMDGQISTSLRGIFDNLLGKDIPVSNIQTMTYEVKEEMRQGRSYEEAVQIVGNREAKNNPEFKRREKLRQYQLDKAKPKVSGVGGSGTKTSSDTGLARYTRLGGNPNNYDEHLKNGTLSAATERLEREQFRKDLKIGVLTEDTRRLYDDISTEIISVDGESKTVRLPGKDIITNLKSQGISNEGLINIIQNENIVPTSEKDAKEGEYYLKDNKLMEKQTGFASGFDEEVMDFNSK